MDINSTMKHHVHGRPKKEKHYNNYYYNNNNSMYLWMITTDNCNWRVCALLSVISHCTTHNDWSNVCFFCFFFWSKFRFFFVVQLNQISLIQFRMCLKQRHAISVYFTHKNKHQLRHFVWKKREKKITTTKSSITQYWLEKLCTFTIRLEYS